MEKLYIKNPIILKSWEKFLVSLFNKHDDGDNDEYYCVKTYYDKECTDKQCHVARRSIDDLLSILNTYYPTVTIEQLAYYLIDKADTHGIKCFYCDDVEHIVFLRFKDVDNSCHIGEDEDEEDGNEDYTRYSEILKMATDYGNSKK